ncbi:50S ribosomal protein L11 methyltransferase [Actinoplanes sp. OR16]|uniref:class I SAM-dependent methyltransferase n=1 Tax=Actinoplanes sp. OR16 TaxID=946334 RepID=UPI000F6D5E8E|nr:50S ribosomal protein L11 methyltransferase [Actinoplanes sp. OR16]BBH66445.1 50S ribosomal protein L11 methyltransferase [Actinoplanes sp. OR16]
MLPTELTPVPFVPEISLYLADRSATLFSGDFHSDQPPPFWAFAWAGGQSLARYLLDHPAEAAGKRVLDVATGSGVAAIAAARCGALSVAATDIDPASVAAAQRNARANGVDLHDAEPSPELVLAGDVFYSPSVAPQMTADLRRARKAGATVLVGDPGRGYFPGRLFELVTEYTVPVPAVLEETEKLVTGVWRMK